MAKKRNKAKKAQGPTPLEEALVQLDQIKHDPSASQVRLRADLTRDTLVEFAGEMRERIRRLRSDRRKLLARCAELRGRLVELLHDLSTGPVILPRPAGRPEVTHEELLGVYRQLRDRDVPALAAAFEEAAGQGRAIDYQRLLTREALINGSRIVVENLVRQTAPDHAPADDEEFLHRLKHHIAGKICSGVARRVGYQVTPELGRHLDAVLGTVLHFLADLLTATPPGRLLVPRDDSPFDVDRHEPIAGRPATGDLKVTATLFPGYLVLEEAPRLVARAQVYTERMQPATPIAPPAP
jgi:hypothetical protein